MQLQKLYGSNLLDINCEKITEISPSKKLIRAKNYIGEIQEASPKSHQKNGRRFKIVESEDPIEGFLRSQTHQLYTHSKKKRHQQSLEQNSYINGYQNQKVQSALLLASSFATRIQTSKSNQREESQRIAQVKERIRRKQSNVTSSEIDLKKVKGIIQEAIDKSQSFNFLDQEFELLQFSTLIGFQNSLKETSMSKEKDLDTDVIQDKHGLAELDDEKVIIVDAPSITWTMLQDTQDILQSLIKDEHKKFDYKEQEQKYLRQQLISIHSKFRSIHQGISHEGGAIYGLILDMITKCFLLCFQNFQNLSDRLYQEQFDNQEDKYQCLLKQKIELEESLESKKRQINQNYKDQILQLNQTIDELRKSKVQIEIQLADLTKEFEQITKAERRKQSIRDVGETYESMNNFLNNMEKEQSKTYLTLRKLEALMVAEKGEINPPKDNEQQTDLTLICQTKACGYYFPPNIQKIPMLMNQSHKIQAKEPSQALTQQDIVSICNNVFENYQNLRHTSKKVEDQILKQIFDKYDKKEDSVLIMKNFIEDIYALSNQSQSLQPALMKDLLRIEQENKEPLTNNRNLVYNVLKNRRALLNRIGNQHDQNNYISLKQLMQIFENHYSQSKELVKLFLHGLTQNKKSVNNLLLYQHIKEIGDSFSVDKILEQQNLKPEEKKQVNKQILQSNNEYKLLFYLMILDKSFSQLNLIESIKKYAEGDRGASSNILYHMKVRLFEEFLKDKSLLSDDQITKLIQLFDPTNKGIMSFQIFLNTFYDDDLVKQAQNVVITQDIIGLLMFNAFEEISQKRIKQFEKSIKKILKDPINSLSYFKTLLLEISTQISDETIAKLYQFICTSQTNQNEDKFFKEFLCFIEDNLQTDEYNALLTYNSLLYLPNEKLEEIPLNMPTVIEVEEEKQPEHTTELKKGTSKKKKGKK